MKHALALVVLFLSVCSSMYAAEDNVPRIHLEKVPLVDAIRNLALQSSLNYIIDPRVPGSSFGPGRLAVQPEVTARWTNVTAFNALNLLLKEHKLTLVTNTATTVARIAPAALGVKPVPMSEVGTHSGAVIRMLRLEDVSLTEAISQLAGAAGLKVSLDPAVSAPAFAGQGTVSFRWEQITARQALAALLDNYGLVMAEDPSTSTVRILLRPK